MIQYSQKIRIQNALVAAAKAGRFFSVSYDKDTGLQTQIDFLTSTDLVTPATVLCNETLSNFGNDRDYGISRVDKRTLWSFDLWIHFNKEVNAEAFEESLIRVPIILDSDKANGLRQVTLKLTRNLPAHPQQQQPSSGTQLRLAFNAEVGRM